VSPVAAGSTRYKSPSAPVTAPAADAAALVADDDYDEEEDEDEASADAADGDAVADGAAPDANIAKFLGNSSTMIKNVFTVWFDKHKSFKCATDTMHTLLETISKDKSLLKTILEKRSDIITKQMTGKQIKESISDSPILTFVRDGRIFAQDCAFQALLVIKQAYENWLTGQSDAQPAEDG
jgi:hypothetical protein